jgi:hypothetical protein
MVRRGLQRGDGEVDDEGEAVLASGDEVRQKRRGALGLLGRELRETRVERR